MILGEVEEIITSVEIDDETYEEIVKVCPSASVWNSNGSPAIMILPQ